MARSCLTSSAGHPIATLSTSLRLPRSSFDSTPCIPANCLPSLPLSPFHSAQACDSTVPSHINTSTHLRISTYARISYLLGGSAFGGAVITMLLAATRPQAVTVGAISAARFKNFFWAVVYTIASVAIFSRAACVHGHQEQRQAQGSRQETIGQSADVIAHAGNCRAVDGDHRISMHAWLNCVLDASPTGATSASSAPRLGCSVVGAITR